MTITLTNIEARILGCLIEKEYCTPDNYPLTLNSLKNATNQKSSREPVMQLEEGEIKHSLKEMYDRHWIITDGLSSRTDKYRQRFHRILELNSQEIAIVSILLLRGAQTLNQIYTRTVRYNVFESSKQTQEVLDAFLNNPQKTIVLLPKTSGEREHRYMHQLCGEVNFENFSKVQQKPLSHLEERMFRLEEQMLDLQEKLENITK